MRPMRRTAATASSAAHQKATTATPRLSGTAHIAPSSVAQVAPSLSCTCLAKQTEGTTNIMSAGISVQSVQDMRRGMSASRSQGISIVALQ